MHKPDELMQCYFSDGISDIKAIGDLLGHSALDFKAETGFWALDGYTSIDSAKSSFLSAVLASGQSENTVGSVLSNRAAWSLSLNFSSFQSFNSNLQGLIENQPEYTAYNKHRKQIESLLGISVENDLLSWIGPEVSMAQLRKNLSYDESENAVFLIKSTRYRLGQRQVIGLFQNK